MSYDSSSGNGTSAIPVITAVNNDFPLNSALITDFTAIAIPKLTGSTDFSHIVSTVNDG